jgi:hypothetical protein
LLIASLDCGIGWGSKEELLVDGITILAAAPVIAATIAADAGSLGNDVGMSFSVVIEYGAIIGYADALSPACPSLPDTSVVTFARLSLFSLFSFSILSAINFSPFSM